MRSGTSIASLVGEEFGPYRLIRRLGVGGMAETYEAIRRGPSGFTQHVCLKLVLPFFRDNPDFVELFEREARLAAKLRHSNIVGVIDFGSIEGIPYMALELVDGADFRVVLDGQDGRRLPPALVALVGTEIAAALEHAHAPRNSGGEGAIIHRDVSPSNVLISRRGEVFLSDFGVAKAISGTSRQRSAVKGKVPYMSPEQLRAQPLDPRADLFSLGVVMFEALGGRRPYEGAHDPATIMLTLEGEHPSLLGLAPGAPAELCEVIESLIRPNRDARPGSASELIDLLDEFVPSPRARRQLGSMVDECSPPVPHVEIRDTAGPVDDEVAAPSPEVTSGARGNGDPAPTSRLGARPHGTEKPVAHPPRWRIWAGLLVVVSLALGAYWLRPSPDDAAAPTTVLPAASSEAPTDEAAPPAKPASQDSQMGALAVPAEPSAPPASEPREAAAGSVPNTTEARPARLTVIVFPWGNVWIDGKLRGAAPLKNEVMKPGRYKVSVGQDAPFKSQSIRLRPGQRRTLDFDLTK